jgi:predicted GNAT family acetyltransferase
MYHACCTIETFMPIETTGCQWLRIDSDFRIAEWYWQQLKSPLKHETWMAAHHYGYQYAVIIAQEKPICCAGVWRFSEEAWDVSAVSTLPPCQNRGYAKRIVSFITAYILASGRTATCETNETNSAMIAVAQKTGFQEVPQDEVWWQYPRLPDF